MLRCPAKLTEHLGLPDALLGQRALAGACLVHAKPQLLLRDWRSKVKLVHPLQRLNF